MNDQDVIRVIIALLFGASLFLLSGYLRRGSREKSTPIELKGSLYGEIKDIPSWKPADTIGPISVILTVLMLLAFAVLALSGEGSVGFSIALWVMVILMLPLGISWGLFLLKVMSARYQRTWSKPLLDLAHSTNMRIAVETGSRYWGHYYPSASGEYRGRPVSMIIDGDYIHPSPGVVPSRITYFSMALPVENKADFSLSIQLKGNLRALIRGDSRKDDFDQNFLVKGSPPEFEKRVRQEISKSPSLPVWKRSNRISIDLKGPVLACKQYNYKVLEASNGIAVLNLLDCIAELAEEMQPLK